jgi:hypothetical protein
MLRCTANTTSNFVEVFQRLLFVCVCMITHCFLINTDNFYNEWVSFNDLIIYIPSMWQWVCGIKLFGGRHCRVWGCQSQASYSVGVSSCPGPQYVKFLMEKLSLGQVYLPVLRFSLVSVITPMLHTHSFIYHRRCTMFFSQYFRFPLSVSFHQCSILIHTSTTEATKSKRWSRPWITHLNSTLYAQPLRSHTPSKTIDLKYRTCTLEFRGPEPLPENQQYSLTLRCAPQSRQFITQSNRTPYVEATSFCLSVSQYPFNRGQSYCQRSFIKLGKWAG